MSKPPERPPIFTGVSAETVNTAILMTDAQSPKFSSFNANNHNHYNIPATTTTATGLSSAESLPQQPLLKRVDSTDEVGQVVEMYKRPWSVASSLRGGGANK